MGWIYMVAIHPLKGHSMSIIYVPSCTVSRQPSSEKFPRCLSSYSTVLSHVFLGRFIRRLSRHNSIRPSTEKSRLDLGVEISAFPNFRQDIDIEPSSSMPPSAESTHPTCKNAFNALAINAVSKTVMTNQTEHLGLLEFTLEIWPRWLDERENRFHQRNRGVWGKMLIHWSPPRPWSKATLRPSPITRKSNIGEKMQPRRTPLWILKSSETHVTFCPIISLLENLRSRSQGLDTRARREFTTCE